VQQILQGAQMNRDLRDYKQLIRVLENGWLITHDEMVQVAEIVKCLKADADRYRWLNRCTAQMFMVTNQQMDDEIDKAMNGRQE
jgi:hypothetical protein